MTQIIGNGGSGGGYAKLCDVVADVPYECWEGESKAISGDKVYAKVSAMDETLSTALQPGDNVSVLCNDAGYIDNTVNDLCNYTLSCDLCAVATSGKYCDLSGTPALCAVATSGSYNDLSNKPTIPGVIDALNSSCTNQALSAKQGCVLNNKIATLEARGRFLSNWNATTGLPVSFPETTPYTYKTGDYFDVTVVGATNYKPSGSSYTGAASTTVETDALAVGDTYVYDGTNWLLQLNHNITTSFSSISGSPYDNSCLSSALGDKANTSSLCAVATSGKYCDLTGTPTLCTVATSGKYCDLSGTPDLSVYQTTANMVCNLSGADNSHYPTAKAVADALSGVGQGDMLKSVYDPNNCAKDVFNYNNLYNKPTIPTNNNQLTNGCGYTTCTGTLVASDLTPYAKSCDLATVATSGKYCDLTGTPTLCTVATSGKYCDLTGQPTIGNATLSICRNCTLVNSFGANATSNVSVNIQVPTDTCELSNTAGFITGISCSDVTTALGYTPYSNANPCGYTSCTGTLTAETVVSGNSGTTYTIKVSNSEPGAGTPSTTITFVTS